MPRQPTPIESRFERQNESEGRVMTGTRPTAPYGDPLHHMAAVLNGEIQEGSAPSSLQTNMTVSEILDAAKQSAQSGKTVGLPLAK